MPSTSGLDHVVLPRLLIRWAPAPGGTDTGLDVSSDGLTFPVLGREAADRLAFVVGNPIWNDRIDREAVLDRMLEVGELRRVAPTLNGQFLLLLAAADRLQIANDRFTSVPLYWARTVDGLKASLLYDDLIPEIRTDPAFAWQEEPMIEFIWFQRVLADKTYDTLSRFLTAASVLDATPSSQSVEPYWQPNYEKRAFSSERQAAAEFGALLTGSLRRLTSDREPKRYGHFLSGGHDSRTVLAAFDAKPHCFTCAFSDNYEVSCARRAAESVGAPFTYIELSPHIFVDQMEPMSRLCGGMYATDHTLFLGFAQCVQEHADVVFHGHGFDYMYQGMYLPARTIHWFGSPTFFRRLQPFEGDLVARYKDGISFGMHDPVARGLIAADAQDRIDAYVAHSVAEVIRSGEGFCRTDADRWEHLINHSLARHYSHPNIMSKATLAEQRIPSFDNDLFDFYLALPNEFRISAQMLRAVINERAPVLGRIPTGNLGLPAGASPAAKTAMLIGRKLLRHLTGQRKYMAPGFKDRTWPDRDSYIRKDPRYRKTVLDAVRSDLLADRLPSFDWTGVRRQTDDWLSGPLLPAPAKFLASLHTLHRFLARHG